MKLFTLFLLLFSNSILIAQTASESANLGHEHEGASISSSLTDEVPDETINEAPEIESYSEGRDAISELKESAERTVDDCIEGATIGATIASIAAPESGGASVPVGALIGCSVYAVDGAVSDIKNIDGGTENCIIEVTSKSKYKKVRPMD